MTNVIENIQIRKQNFSYFLSLKQIGDNPFINSYLTTIDLLKAVI
jgi:hypothetical protein